MTTTLILLIGIIALLYSSVGHGGASGYIAIFSLFNYLPANYKPIVLILNVLTASIAFYNFYQAGYFDRKLALTFVAASIPAAFLGALIHIPLKIFNVILGVTLLFASIQLFIKSFAREQTNDGTPPLKQAQLYELLSVGGVIGLISGMLNIGGGIFLSPVILLKKWANVKTTAATSSFFIVCNSMAGLATLKVNQITFSAEDIAKCIITALICGIIGSRLGSKILEPTLVQKTLAFTLFLASTKLCFFIK